MHALKDTSDESAHKTKGDLIFSASRTRFTLFHACGDLRTRHVQASRRTYRSNRGEDAGLTPELLVVD